jgi:hypothetical protein
LRMMERRLLRSSAEALRHDEADWGGSGELSTIHGSSLLSG